MVGKAADMKDVIGKQLNRDIFSDNGVLLVPAAAIITREHAGILSKHGILLGSADVSEIGPYAHIEPFDRQPAVDEAVLQAGELFGEIRDTRKVPLSELRGRVIPLIHEAAASDRLFGLFASLQAKDDYTYRHNVAVGAIASLIGSWMGLDRQELLQLTTAALLHDVGKMLIPQTLLNKPDKLTEEEFAIMKQHTVLGYEILKETVGVNHRQALVALQHHERMDGGGYPFGLTQDKIERFSKIVSVADIFHAMTSRRVYRNPSPFYEVLAQIEANMFGALDPSITRLFIQKIMNSLIGRTVLLTDGIEGTIRLIRPHDPTRPLIQAGEQFVDLSADLAVRIKQIM